MGGILLSLDRSEVAQICDVYLGGFDGFNFFTHSKLRVFLKDHCGIEIPEGCESMSKRDLLFESLLAADSNKQIKALSLLLEHFEQRDLKADMKSSRVKLQEVLSKLRHSTAVEIPDWSFQYEAVNSALQSLKDGLKNGEHAKVVDRSHTVIHGQLKLICYQRNLNTDKKNPNSQDYLHMIIDSEIDGYLANSQPTQIKQLLNSFLHILKSLDELRNKHSSAHPNQKILSYYEAQLAINAAITLASYLKQFETSSK